MEPNLSTAVELLGVLEELRRREPIFHRPEFGTSRADFEGMIEQDFWEIGASGRRYSRQCVLDVLDARYSSPAEDEWQTVTFIAAGSPGMSICLPIPCCRASG
jgi:hypothetical protein